MQDTHLSRGHQGRGGVAIGPVSVATLATDRTMHYRSFRFFFFGLGAPGTMHTGGDMLISMIRKPLGIQVASCVWASS